MLKIGMMQTGFMKWKKMHVRIMPGRKIGVTSLLLACEWTETVQSEIVNQTANILVMLASLASYGNEASNILYVAVATLLVSF